MSAICASRSHCRRNHANSSSLNMSSSMSTCSFALRSFENALRLLKPRGVLRLVGPGCAQFADAYSRRDIEWFRRVLPGTRNLAEGLNDIFKNHFHRFIDDFESLACELKAQGFAQVEESFHLSSRLPELRVDLDEPTRIPGNLYLEARK